MAGIPWDGLKDAASPIVAAMQAALNSSPEARRQRNEESVREIERMLAGLDDEPKADALEQALVGSVLSADEIEAQMSEADRDANRDYLDHLREQERLKRERDFAVEREWDELVAASKTMVQDFVDRHEGSVGYRRLMEQGFDWEVNRVLVDGEPIDPSMPEQWGQEVVRLTPAIEVPVPRFVAHLFQWDDWKRDEGIGLLLILPVDPNFTHGEEWWKRDPEDWRNVLEKREPDAFNLYSVPQWDGWSNSHGYWSDPKTVEYHYGPDHYEVEINGQVIPEFGRLESYSNWPWNCIGHDVAFQPTNVRMRAKGIYDCMSDQFPQDGEWSEPVVITHAYRMDQIPAVFDTVFPDAADGRNFSARLDHVTTITPDLPLS